MNGGRRHFRPVPLVLSRIVFFWGEVWKCWRLTLDWTVQVYIAIPALFIGANMYRDAWLHPPSWFAAVPQQTVFVLLAAAMLRARARTFADYGDGLFLRRSARWTRPMIATGLAYTLLVRLLTAAAVVALLAPLLDLRFGWDAATGAAMAGAAALLGYAWTLVRDGLERRRSGWRRVAAVWVARLMLMAAWVAGMTAIRSGASFGLALAALIAASCLLTWLRLRAKGTFLHEVAAEREAYSACVRFLLMEAGGARSVPRGRKPLLSLRRNLFRRRGTRERIAELWVKAKLRDPENVQALLTFAAIGSAAVALPPPGLGLAMWPVSGLFALFWLHGQWKQWEGERYVAMLPWPPLALREAEGIGRRALFLPLFGLWGLALGCKIGLLYGGAGWLAVPLAPAVGWAAGRYLDSVVSVYLQFRKRKRKAQTGERPSGTEEEEARENA